MKGLLIIPAYNEEENIGALLDELDSGYSAYDYIVVNDDLKHASAELRAIMLAEKCKTMERIHLIKEEL